MSLALCTVASALLNGAFLYSKPWAAIAAGFLFAAAIHLKQS